VSRPNIIFIISAPSGAGKTTLVNALLQADPRLHNTITHTTRKKRPDEANGVHYHFVSQEQFTTLKEQGFFVETAEIYGENYGTSKTAIENILAKNQDVLINMDWQGARNLRSAFANDNTPIVSIFVLPPSINELRTRMLARGDENTHEIEARLKAAEAEIAHASEYDYHITNDDFNAALEDLTAIIRAARTRTQH
jgi:guanylate kinase